MALIRRIDTATLEISTALASAKKAPAVNVPAAPGWVTTSTPTNPTISADQRWMPTVSLRIMIDSSVVNSGAEKPIAIAEPSGKARNASIMQVIEPNCDSPRCTCSR